MRSPAVFVLLLSFVGQVHGQAFIEDVSPPSIQPGKTTRVTVRGSHLQGVVGLWNSLPKGVVEAKPLEDREDEAVFAVRVAPSAPRGLYGVRVATRDGLSNAHLIVIDDLRTVQEEETHLTHTDNERDRALHNDLAEKAQLLTLPVAVAGTCRPEDIDHYAIHAEQGQQITIEVVGNRLGKPLDPLVTIYDDQGNQLALRDNDQGLFFDVRFRYRFKKTGRYVIAVNDARFHGSPYWSYLLRLGRFPVARVLLPSSAPSGHELFVNLPQQKASPFRFRVPSRRNGDNQFFVHYRGLRDDASTWLPFTSNNVPVVLEQEPNDEQQQANAVSIPCSLHGRMNKASDWDMFRLNLKRGQRINFTAHTRGIGSPADLELTLYDPKGKAVKTVDDTGFEDANFLYGVPADGEYLLKVLEVVRKGGRAYAYRIDVQLREPEVTLTSEAGRLAVPQGTWQPLPLKIGRQDCAGPVTLLLEGAPHGVTLRDNIIPATVNEWTGALQVSPSTPPGIYTMRVVCHLKYQDETLSALARTQPLIDRVPTGRGPHGEPFELREVQRRLPPSLTNRIALVVLPPAPFDFRITTPDVILGRFSESRFGFETTRKNGYARPIEFVARGGQLEYNRLQPPPVKALIPTVGPQAKSLTSATLRSGVNTNTIKHRVTVTATTKQENGRVINLTRTFQLDIQQAFAPKPLNNKLTIAPGETKRVDIAAHRLPPFNGRINLIPAKVDGLTIGGLDKDGSIAIPVGKDTISLELTADKTIKAGAHNLSFSANTRVGKFYEEARASTLNITVAAPSDKTQDKTNTK